jgi:hypothetical protein
MFHDFHEIQVILPAGYAGGISRGRATVESVWYEILLFSYCISSFVQQLYHKQMLERLNQFRE